MSNLTSFISRNILPWLQALRALEEDVRRCKEQLQMLALDHARHEGSVVAQERCTDKELGAIPARKKNLDA